MVPGSQVICSLPVTKVKKKENQFKVKHDVTGKNEYIK